MYFRKLTLFVFLFLFAVALCTTADASVTIDPIGVAVAVDNGDTLASQITLTNHTDEAVQYTVKFEKVPEPEQQGPRRDDPEDLVILILKSRNDEAFGWHNRDSWMVVFDNQEEDITRANIEALADYDLEDYDFVCTGEDQEAAFFQGLNQNRERFEEYLDGGGVMAIFAGSNSFQDVTLPGGIRVSNGPRGDWGDVNADFVNEDGNGLIEGIEEDYPILTPFEQFRDDNQSADRVRIRMRGNSLNFATVVQNDIPDDGIWYYRPADQQNTAIIAEWPVGGGQLLFTGITGTLFFEQNWQWSSMMECINLTKWADAAGGNRWIAALPKEGEIDANDEAQFELVFTPGEIEAGTYETWVNVETTDPESPILKISAILSVGVPLADVTGTVIDQETERPIEGAQIDITGHYFSRFTNEDGEFYMFNSPLGDYNITISASDYLTINTDVVLEDEGDVRWSVEMYYATFDHDLDPDEGIDMALEPDFSIDTDFNVENNGNGPLSYRVERHLLGGADADPWTERESFYVSDRVNDRTMSGVVFVDDQFYVTGGYNNNADSNFVYVFDSDGEYVRRFQQWMGSRAGMRDLTYDGELIWGGDARTLYGFTPEGELREQFDTAPINPARAVAYDSDRDIIWVSAERSATILGFNRDGEQTGEIEKEVNISTYGMSYYPEDPDGYTLYLFSRDGEEEEDSDTRVYKVNPDNGRIMFVEDLHTPNGRAGGIHIVNTFDIYSWVMISLNEAAGNDPDGIYIYQVEARLDWMQIEPTMGMIEVNQSQNFQVILDSHGIPEADFMGEFVFFHDGVGSITTIPVTMHVTTGPVQTFRRIPLNLGWNMVSTNVLPEDDDVELIMAPLVEQGLLRLIKDDNGDFYSPSHDINNIDGWQWDKGYMVKVLGNAVLRIDGTSVVADDTLNLTAGWQMVSYLPRRPVNAVLALSGIVDELVIAKDGLGNFYVPSYGFSNLGSMREGRGYMLKVTDDVDLIYTTEEPQEDEVASIVTHRPGVPELPSTGQNMSLLVKSSSLPDGEISVYSNDILVGRGKMEAGMAGIAVWGDDVTTSEVDGAIAGQPLQVRFNGRAMELKAVAGENSYHTDGLIVAELVETALPGEFTLGTAYPNPFNSTARVTFSLPNTSDIRIGLFDIAGREVMHLMEGTREAGYHQVTIQGNGLPSGVYVVRMDAAGQVVQTKVALVK